MFGYFQDVVENRRAQPGDDITSTVVHSEIDFPDGTRLLTDEELDRMFLLLLMAGCTRCRGRWCGQSCTWSTTRTNARRSSPILV